jgi:nitroimidazol reductase NimA-like FMN-containing flavoprotein (pyridoxamine 5'-phosphate oxidase superfamily)
VNFRLSQAETWEFIDRAHTGILSTLRRDGRPITLPVWHVAFGQRVYLRTPVGTSKLIRIGRDARASFLVESGEAWIDLIAVGFDGRATIEDDPALVAEAHRRLDEKYAAFEPPLDRVPPPVATYYTSPKRIVAVEPEGRVRTWNNRALLTPAQPSG